MFSRSSLVALLLVLLPGSRALAQGISSNAEAPRAGEEIKGDTRVVEIDEVERGLWMSVDYGPNYYIPLGGPGFVNLNPTWTLPGTRVGTRVGFDILNNIAIDAFVLGNFNQGLINIEDARDKQMTGDLSHLSVGAGARFAFITTERVFTFVRAGGGYALWFPASLAGNMGSVHLDASLGVEYYTKLRHLSVGVEADFQALIAPMAIGVQVYPTLKYTF